MNVPPVSVERAQKCVVNFEIHRFLKKAANLPHPPLTSHTASYPFLRPTVHVNVMVSHISLPAPPQAFPVRTGS